MWIRLTKKIENLYPGQSLSSVVDLKVYPQNSGRQFQTYSLEDITG